MARAAKVTKSAKPAADARRPGRVAASTPKGRSTATKPAPVARRAPTAGAATAKPSKDELRAQVERLEASVVTLRAKSREANRLAKAAAARITELEEHVARLEAEATRPAAAARPDPAPASLTRGKRKMRDVDPGDAVPPGVAALEPEPLDEEAETVKDNLDKHLGASS